MLIQFLNSFTRYFHSGSVVPYLIAWTLYQGSLLMTLVNWTGLIVNGFVAFLLPMFLVLYAIPLREKRKKARLVSGINF